MLDYKQALPQTHQKDKVDFLKDVAGLANTEGGDILFGVSEKREGGKTTGEPEAVVGLQGFLADQEIRRLEDTIRTGLKPRLTGVRLQSIQCPEGPVLHMRVERSFAGPHMVLHDEERFWGRGAMGNFRLDPDELRRLFQRNADLPERIRRFRAQRVETIERVQTPVTFPAGPTLILHVVSVPGFDLQSALDVRRAVSVQNSFLPLGWSSSALGRFNIDGYVNYADVDKNGVCRTYTQLFRNGAIESVLSFPPASFNSSATKFFAYDFARLILEHLPRYLVGLGAADVPPPYVVMVSFLGVKDLELPGYWSTTTTVDRNTVLVPDLLLNEVPSSYTDELRPVFDAMWQAAGKAGWPDQEYEKAKKRESR
ncbi:putative DNA binding domain-containing protein [bacterium]|nr:putative DNA binding domain-containing protein [bacterium]